jgi:hypothetical protein
MNTEMQHYQKNPKEAFRKGFTMRTVYEHLGSELYEVHKFYLPLQIAKKVRWLRKYFISLDRADIPIERKRRKHWCEFAETALSVLSRIDMLLSKDFSFLAGSKHVSALPWATFGAAYKSRLATNFTSAMDIVYYYQNSLHGQCYPVDLHFRTCPGLAAKLAKKYREPMRSKLPFSSANFWMAVAIVLTYDLIRNCGPDCHEIYDLFTNDYQENPDNINIEEWQDLRCLILGVPKPPKQFVGPPLVLRARQIAKSKTEIKEISCNVALEDGEKTKPVFYPKTIAVPGESVGFENLTEEIGFGIHGIGPHRPRYKYGIVDCPNLL